MTERQKEIVAGLPERIVDRIGRAATYALPAIGSLVVLYACIPLLEGGVGVGWDEIYHQATEKLTAEMLGKGENPWGLLQSMFGYPGFRFYQSLHYLLAAAIQLATGAGATIVHNWLVVLLFAATPWTYRRLCLSIGLTPFAAGAAGLLCVASINGTSNSFESYFECAFVTQALASVLLPLALAALVTLVREGRGTVRVGVLMALTVLAHAAFAIYAALAAALVIVVFLPTDRRTWLRLGGAAALAGVLAAGWAVPFVHYQRVDKPVSDMVARADRTIWFNGLDPGEMSRQLASGRLLDGGKMDNTPEAKTETLLNMVVTEETRFPFLTLLAAAGLLVALAGYRRPENRLLIAGLSFGLLLMLGADDFREFYRLPLASSLQAFRVSYFIELFAFALGGAALARFGALLVTWCSKIVPALVPKIVAALLVGGGLCYFWTSTVRIATPIVDTRDVSFFNRVIDVIDKSGKASRQKRVAVKFSKPDRKFKFALEHWIELEGGYSTVCNHWTSSSPTNNLHVCGPLSAPWTSPQYQRLLGIRFFVIERGNVDKFVGDDSPLKGEYRKLGRVGSLGVVEDRRAGYLHEAPGPRVLVVATPAQWYWLTKRWVARWPARIGRPETPWPLLVPSEALEDEALVGAADAVLYLDDRDVDRDRAPLSKIAASEKKLALGMPVDGVAGHVLGIGDPSWDAVLKLPLRPSVGAAIKRLDRGKDPDRLRFRVDASAPTLFVLSMQHFEDWRARIDGRPVTVASAGPDMVAVVAPSGEHEIDFAYEQSTMEITTMWISAIGWAGVIAFGLFLTGRGGWRRLRKKKAV
ncbi:MAG: hypothetical protein M0R80_22965 [Proteobacteria bacterium]|jgi:hypothetical protein|nr:hypothetical protein [Pseudomonadota bacterium]